MHPGDLDTQFPLQMLELMADVALEGGLERVVGNDRRVAAARLDGAG